MAGCRWQARSEKLFHNQDNEVVKRTGPPLLQYSRNVPLS
jgi:hypothetical protein